MPLTFRTAVSFAVRALAAASLPVAVLSIEPAAANRLDLAPSDTLTTPPPLLAQTGVAETVLYFETDSMAVRIFSNGSALFMNLYNRVTDMVEVNGAPAEMVSRTRDQTVYKNSRGEADRFARINIRGETDLEIVAPDGTVVLQEPGFNALVGIPDGETNFQGNNFAPGIGAIVISREYANLRSEPRLGSEILGSADRRETVDVLDRVGNPEDGYIWYRVIYDGITGWIRGDLLQPA
jgi:hypothetical protein